MLSTHSRHVRPLQLSLSELRRLGQMVWVYNYVFSSWHLTIQFLTKHLLWHYVQAETMKYKSMY